MMLLGEDVESSSFIIITLVKPLKLILLREVIFQFIICENSLINLKGGSTNRISSNII